MEARLDYKGLYQEAVEGLTEIEQYVRHSPVEKRILGLVKIRASELNGCAFCLDIHSKEALHAGETEQRIYSLGVWRETDYYTDREQAALEWTEALTLISTNDVPDKLYESVSKQFSEKELVTLTMAVISINAFNRLAKPFKKIPGTYKIKED